jgi:2-polyprenyl-3-methyl-5-hydroxy-6-metoxy-1,4-benzoquinol methylase
MNPPICPLCKGTSFQPIFTVSGVDQYLNVLGISHGNLERSWLRCHECGHLSNSVRLELQEQRTLYQKFRDQEWRKESPDAYFNRITSLTPSESENYQKIELIKRKLGIAPSDSRGKMIDIGCGGGVLIHTAKLVFGENWQFFGVEPTESFALLASRRTGASVIAAEYHPGIFVNQQFDLATCCQVLEHVERPQEFLNGIRGDLKDGGNLYLEVPDISDFDSLERSHDRFMCQQFSYFSRSILSTMLEHLRIIEVASGVTKTVRNRNNLWVIAQAT